MINFLTTILNYVGNIYTVLLENAENICPTLFMLLFMVITYQSYRGRIRNLFWNHPGSPEDKLTEEQIKRFEPYKYAERLQLATNRWHNLAVRSKSWYEAVGVIACSAAPALIILAAGRPSLEAVGLASDYGMSIATCMTCLLVLTIIWIYRHPTKKHVENRLRSEWLRSHVHCLLARVGPYASGNETEAERVLGKVDTSGIKETLSELNELRRVCSDQSKGATALAEQILGTVDTSDIKEILAKLKNDVQVSTEQPKGATALTVECAETYYFERVDEQLGLKGAPVEGFFTGAIERMERAYKNTAWVIFTLVAFATLVALSTVFASVYINIDLAKFLISFCGAVAMLTVSLRAVFGWDGKASLYTRQVDSLTKHAAAMLLAMQAMRKTTNETLKESFVTASELFRHQAAAFEARMAQEARDWQLISDREYYDVTF